MAFSNGYTYRKSITIDHTKIFGGADLNDFVILISFTDTDLETVANGGKVEDSNGYDIIFTDSSATLLDFEMESYDAATGKVIAWVRVPTLHYLTDDILYVYYGNSSISTSQEDVTGTWTAFDAVYHLNESAGGSGAIKDRTSGANHMSSVGSQLTYGVTGKINKAISRTNSSSEVSRLLSDSTLNIPSGGLTFLIWANPTSSSQASNGRMLGDESATPRYRIFTTGSNTFQTRVYKTSGTLDGISFGAVSTSAWTHLAVRIPGVASNYTKTYINGSNANTGSSVDSYIGTNEEIALFGSSTASQWYYGALSHFKIAIGDLGEGWIQTEYNNQDNPSVFYAIGSEETSGGGGGGGTLNLQINTGNDDSREESNGNANHLTDSTLYVSTSSDSYIMGIFRGAIIPQGATITAATIEVNSYDYAGVPFFNVTIYGEDVDTPANLGSGSNNISARSRTTASVSMTEMFSADNTFYVSPDISTIIQEIVSRATFGESAIGIIIRGGTNTGAINAYDANPAYAMKLNVTYTTGGGGGTVVRHLALLGVG